MSRKRAAGVGVVTVSGTIVPVKHGRDVLLDRIAIETTTVGPKWYTPKELGVDSIDWFKDFGALRDVDVPRCACKLEPVFAQVEIGKVVDWIVRFYHHCGVTRSGLVPCEMRDGSVCFTLDDKVDVVFDEILRDEARKRARMLVDGRLKEYRS